MRLSVVTRRGVRIEGRIVRTYTHRGHRYAVVETDRGRVDVRLDPGDVQQQLPV